MLEIEEKSGDDQEKLEKNRGQIDYEKSKKLF